MRVRGRSQLGRASAEERAGGPSASAKKMATDMRIAIRRLLSQPGSTALMILILAVGIGTAAAVFTIVDHTLFRLPPFANF